MLLRIQAGAKPEPGSPIADVLPLTLDRLAGFQTSKEPARAAIIRRINDVVADPDLSQAVCERIAREIVDGAYPEHRLDTILRKIVQKRRAETLDHPGKYFVGSMVRSFRDHGVPLPFVSPKRE